MSLIVGDNSYVDVAEADDYFADKYGYDSWQTEPNKEQALVSAAQYLDLMCNWFSEKCVPDQAMEFPREPDCSGVPLAIKQAQMEIAFNITVNGGTDTSSTTGELTELKAGSATLKFAEMSSEHNPLRTGIVDNLVSAYGSCGGGSTSLVGILRQ